MKPFAVSLTVLFNLVWNQKGYTESSSTRPPVSPGSVFKVRNYSAAGQLAHVEGTRILTRKDGATSFLSRHAEDQTCLPLELDGRHGWDV